MASGVVIAVVVCVAVVIGAVACRDKEVMKTSLSPAVAFGLVLVAVIVASLVLYAVVMRPPTPVQGDEAMAPGEGSMGMGGGGMGGERPPNPSRELRQTVEKLNLYQQQNPDALTAAQKQSLVVALKALVVPKQFTDEDATAAEEKLVQVLTEEQRTALDAVELPRRAWGSGAAAQRPPEGQSPETATPQAPDAAPAPQQDRRAAFRERMMSIPAVKSAYDEKVAADPAFAEDADAQRDFFRSIMREINPFTHGRGQEALESLLTALEGTSATPQ